MKRASIPLTAALLLLAQPAVADTLFESAPPDFEDALIITHWTLAEHFTFGNPVQVDAMNFTQFQADSFDWDLSLRWWLFDNAAAEPPPLFRMPGEILASGVGVNVQREFIKSTTEPHPGLAGEWYAASFDFNEPLDLAANKRYWIGLNLNDDFIGGEEIAWGRSFINDQFQDGAFASPDGMFDTRWDPIGVTYAFSLEGTVVPEPSTITLAALALLGLFGYGRQRGAST